MIRGGRALLAAVAAVALAACAGPVQAPEYAVEGLLVLNRTGSDVQDVRVSVPATGAAVACGRIPEQAGCSTTFPDHVYRGTPLTVSWTEGGRTYRDLTVTLAAPAAADRVAALTAVVELAAGGGVRARLLRPRRPAG